jgi:vacuolar-type H+-ATPase subunit I/STV1
MNNLSVTILVTGFFCLAIGLVLYFVNQRKKYGEHFNTTHIICWILIALVVLPAETRLPNWV